MRELTVGQRIKDLRTRKGRTLGRRYTQGDLAAAVGVHKGTVAAWETDRQVPEGENLERLAAALGVTPELIIAGEAESEPEAESAENLFGKPLDEVLRQFRGWGRSEEAQARKRNAITLTERTYAAYGWELPSWWYQLVEKIDRGEA